MDEFLAGEYSPLVERAVRRDGTIGLKVIAPGWGSSGYYSPEVLERDIPKVFPPGTHMMWNHPTVTEEVERPEGDLSNLAAVTVSPAQWREGGPEGPGVYVDAKVFPGYAEAIDEIAEYIGVSIRGMGKQSTGEAEGRSGLIIDEITAGKSIDFVTSPGAGGRILQVYESAPDAVKLPEPETLQEDDDIPTEDNSMELEQQLQEAQDQLKQATSTIADLTATNEQLQERLLLQEAHRFVTAALLDVDLPVMTRERIARQLNANPPIVDGKIDEAAYKEAIDKAVTEAQAEIAAITGQDGKITGQGQAVKTDGPTLAESGKRIDAALAELGYGGKE